MSLAPQQSYVISSDASSCATWSRLIEGASVRHSGAGADGSLGDSIHEPIGSQSAAHFLAERATEQTVLCVRPYPVLPGSYGRGEHASYRRVVLRRLLLAAPSTLAGADQEATQHCLSGHEQED